MKIAKTARLPATVAIVSSHQRRRTSLTVSLRNSARPSGQPSTGPRWIGRRSRFTATAATRPMSRARCSLQKTSTSTPTATAKTMPPTTAAVVRTASCCSSIESMSTADDREHQVRELVPHTRQRDGARHGPRLEAPGPQEAVGAGHPDDPAAGRDVGERRRGLREEERLHEAEAGERDHPRRRERDDVEHDADAERHEPDRIEVRDDVPDVAVVRDLRQDDEERDGDDGEAQGAEQEIARPRAHRATLRAGADGQSRKDEAPRSTESRSESGSRAAAKPSAFAVVSPISPSCSASSTARSSPSRRASSSSSRERPSLLGELLELVDAAQREHEVLP